MHDCKHFEELCSASIDGELTHAQKRELDAHLKDCPACAAYLEDIRLLRTAWGDFKEPLPEVLHEGIMRGILAEAETKVRPAEKAKRLPPVFTMIAAAAACVMLVMSGVAGDLLGGLKIDAPAVAGGGAAAGRAATGTAPAALDAGSSAEDEFAPSSEEVPVPAAIAPTPKVGTDTPQERAVPAEPFQNAAGSAPQKSSTFENSGEAALFAQDPVASGSARDKNAADGFSVTLPSGLQAHRFGFCYVAVGSGDPPALEQASLIEKDDSTYYFRIENNMSGLEKLRSQLREAGYETALRTDIGVALDENAADSLLILSVGQS